MENIPTLVNSISHQTYNALGESGSLTINLNSSPSAVLKHRQYDDYQFPENSYDVQQLFEDMQRELLILGAPGSGKTILLLQLAEKLIAEASENDKLAMPVLFNLSSWAAKRQSLRDWLIDELNIKYQIPKKIGKQWIEHEKLLLLLDGLDEVVEAHREECLEAINVFREEYRSVDMAICSRIDEYEALTSKLDLQGAITLQALSDEQVQDYLSGDAYVTLREIMTKDDTLQDIAEVPFLLNTMAYAYHDANPALLALADDEKRTNHLFERYVEQRIQEDNSDLAYTPKQTRHYLKWLANMMVDKGETTFAIESFEPLMIEGRLWRIVFRVLYGLISGLSIGLSIGLISGLPLSFSLNNLNQHRRWSIKNAIIGGVAGSLSIGLIDGLIFGLSIGLVLSPIFAIIGGLRPSAALARAKPNQGFRSTLRSSITILIVVGILMLSIAFGGALILDQLSGFSSVVVLLIPIVWVIFGGAAIVRHMVTRLILGQRGHIPIWRYDKFLDHAATDLHILRKVGGSYIFRHRYLLEYFAGRELK